ncbi:glycosyltransferase family 2 protein [Flavihumibacter fluvii]|uniref:glycosyltransferase family 2 protein n=1 Tax=Flavihumibacter fluvii TaxID=2838157 RepID=UPI001BDF23DC|nr:glycosyltransferase [Flavihumibacter fluvii]ULQ52432.1 glycosyltransferase [Flavihumibacter fluvii]
MRTLAPYQIRHFQLDHELDELFSMSEKVLPLYAVCWWKSIPLTHFFIDEKQTGWQEQMTQQLEKNLARLLNGYGAQDQQCTDAVIAMRSIKQQEFNRVFEAIFQPYLPVDIPEMADISVVICTRNRSEVLQRCLTALQQQACLPKEIIVVDNAPDDDRSELIALGFGTVKYVREPKAGLDIARNTGALHSSCPVVAYIDDDVLVDPHWIYRVNNVFEKTEADAMTGLVLPLSLETDSQLIFEKFWSFNKGFTPKVFTKDFLVFENKSCPRVWRIGAGANMAFRKAALEKVHYFDERLDAGAAGCSGDSEAWFRVLLSGGKILYDPLAVVYHEHRSDMKGLKKQLFNYMKGNVVAALIQHQSAPWLGYRKHVWPEMPRNYLMRFLVNLKRPGIRNKTMYHEAAGVLAGIVYYWRNKNRSGISQNK